MIRSLGGDGDFGFTQTAGTRIQFVIPSIVGAITRLTRLVYDATGTSHTLTILRAIGRTIANATGASGQANVTFLADPGPSGDGLAANDLVVIRETDGVQRLYKVSSVPGAYPGVVVLSTNLAAGVVQGSKIWDVGVTTDTNPQTGRAHSHIPSGTGNKTLQDSDAGIQAGLATDDPLVFDSDNSTNPGTITQIGWSFTPPVQ
jgi:hypothetical protein